MAEYHVGCGAFAIYAGTTNKDKTLWKNKSDVTNEAIEAVMKYMVQDILGGFDCSLGKHTGGYQWDLTDGNTVELRVSINKGDNDE